MIFRAPYFNPSIQKRNRQTVRAVFLFVWILVALASTGWCDPVDQAAARVVAENTLRRHIELYGDWNGSTAPIVAYGQGVQYQGRSVAYNFTISPGGHILVAADDLFSPVQLYSTRASFDPARADQPQVIESWIVPELGAKKMRLDQYRRSLMVPSAMPQRGERIARAWEYFQSFSTEEVARSAVSATASGRPTIGRAATVGPLLTTRWGQSDPYNLQTPADTGCAHTLTGCVATAWAQVLKYWEWPVQGIGSHTYAWNNQTLTVDFGASTYDWINMPDAPDGNNNDENDAVSKLMYDLAVAAETDFGCSESSSFIWADEVLDIFFRYKAMTYHDRLDYTDEAWFGLFKSELDADPPRPVIFSIFSDLGGHEVVVDGYQDDVTNKVHINFGWSSLSYDGYYDVTDDDDFNTLIYDWSVDEQYIVAGIEPNESLSLPTVDAGENQMVNERTAVSLSGGASHTGHSISSYQWRRLDDPAFVITNATEANASFTAPDVSFDTHLVFRLKAVDEQGSVSFDECTVTVRNVDPAAAPAPVIVSGGSGGGGGGCFIESVLFRP